MEKIKIKSLDGIVLFTHECVDNTIWLTVEAAVKQGVILSRADLSGADLNVANLSGADLSGADLSGAYLSLADLRRADLRGADLSGADLRGADLRVANLRGDDLSGADLSRADLRGADLSGANIDFSCLPLWCGGKFKTDEKICKQLVAHVVRIMELSEIDAPELIALMNEFKYGWHHAPEF